MSITKLLAIEYLVRPLNSVNIVDSDIIRVKNHLVFAATVLKKILICQ